VPLVSADWVREHQDEVTLVDVRELHEAMGPLGRIEGAEIVPMVLLATRMRTWTASTPIVFVGTYTGRAGFAASQLEALGFERVAALQGGMAEWHARGFDVRVDAPLLG
jgi:rhodanese-related sulfurtransferase